MKRIAALLLCLLLASQLCACTTENTQPTASPETTVEVSRGEADGDVNKLAASAVAYTDSFQNTEGTVNVQVDFKDVQLLNLNFGSLRVSPRPFTEEEAERAARVLFGENAVLYEWKERPYQYTKAELEKSRAIWQELLEGDRLTELYGDNSNLYRDLLESCLEQYRVENMPDSIERTACSFTYKSQASYHPVSSDGYIWPEDWRSIEAVTEVNGLPYHFSVDDNTDRGRRVYSIAAYISTETLSPLSVEEDLMILGLLSPEGATVEQLDAVREKAEKMIAALDIGQWQINCCESRPHDLSDVTPLKEILVTAVPVYNDIPVLQQTQLSGLSDDGQDVYYQNISFSFAPDGTLLRFEMYSPMEVTEESVEELRTLSFTELMDSLKSQLTPLAAEDYAHYPMYPGDTTTAEVFADGIQLGYSRVLVENSADYLLVPSVTILGNYRSDIMTQDNTGAPVTISYDFRAEEGRDAVLLTLNATDGSAISTGSIPGLNP